MPRKEIVEFVSTDLGIGVGEAKRVVERVLDAFLDTVATEGRLELRNFGVFEVRRRKARRAHNPRTGEKVDVPEKNVVTFTPGMVMQQRIEGGPRRHTQTANPPNSEPQT